VNLATGSARRLNSEERELLRHIAEELLFVRGQDLDSAEIELQEAAALLSHQVGVGRIPSEEADELWRALVGCGPEPRV
jgi:hypothetical protein